MTPKSLKETLREAGAAPMTQPRALIPARDGITHKMEQDK